MKNLNYDEELIAKGKYILKTKNTIRGTAQFFKQPKSNIYIQLTKKLPEVDLELAREVSQLLMKNKQERHIRGGKATKQKYLCKKQSK